MANSTKRDIVQKLRREEQMAIKATRFMKKPMTIRQTKRTIAISIFGGVLLLVLSVLRFTVLDSSFEPFAYNVITPKATPSPPPASATPMSIEQLEKQASSSGPADKSSK